MYSSAHDNNVHPQFLGDVTGSGSFATEASMRKVCEENSSVKCRGKQLRCQAAEVVLLDDDQVNAA